MIDDVKPSFPVKENARQALKNSQYWSKPRHRPSPVASIVNFLSMPDLNLIICFGPTENDFIIGYGSQALHKNAPTAIVNIMDQGTDYNPMKIGWISIHPNFRTAVCMSWVTGRVAWTTDVPKEIEAYYERPGLTNTISYFTFADSDDGFFIRFRPGGHPEGRSWILNIRPDYPDQIETLMSEMPEFTDRLRYIVFGHGGTHIYVFDTGFYAHLEGKANGSDHPLNKTIKEFAQPGWTLQDGSTLSLYDDEFFCLKFVHAESEETQIRFNLPVKMHNHLMTLVEETAKPTRVLELQKIWETAREEADANAGNRTSAVRSTPLTPTIFTTESVMGW